MNVPQVAWLLADRRTIATIVLEVGTGSASVSPQGPDGCLSTGLAVGGEGAACRPGRPHTRRSHAIALSRNAGEADALQVVPQEVV